MFALLMRKESGSCVGNSHSFIDNHLQRQTYLLVLLDRQQKVRVSHADMFARGAVARNVGEATRIGVISRIDRK